MLPTFIFNSLPIANSGNLLIVCDIEFLNPLLEQVAFNYLWILTQRICI